MNPKHPRRQFAPLLIAGLTACALNGCGPREKFQVCLTDCDGAAVAGVSVEVVSPLRVLPGLPESWGTTDAAGTVKLGAPAKPPGFMWMCRFSWKSSDYSLLLDPRAASYQELVEDAQGAAANCVTVQVLKP